MEPQIFAPKPDNKLGPWDVAIIGSGPSGLTAAIYTTRGAASTIIFGGETWGGQLMLTTNVDNYSGLPGVMGPELMAKMKDHSQLFGAEFLDKTVESVDLTKSPFELTVAGEKYLARSIIIATGAETKWLDAPGISKLIGRGVSSCAPCDAPFFKNKKVAVVGGGDSAMEEASVLTKYADEVIMIHRRDSFRASAAMQEKVISNSKIKIFWNTEVKEAHGEAKLEKLTLLNNKTNKTSELSVDGLFVAIGHTPSTKILEGKIELDGRGYVKRMSGNSTRMPTYQSATSVQGVFVSGDVHDTRYKQAITAAGFGCMAGMDVLEFLEETKSEG
jgi:thioredoxin reductase (NADPH)